MSPIQLNMRSNTAWAATEVVISGLSLFLLYKFVIANVGITGLGLWSLVLATTSLARFGDIGTAAGLSRFVAIAKARGDSLQAALYVETAFVSSFLLNVVAGLLLIWPLYHGLSWVVPVDRLGEARILLPYAILSFMLLNLSAVSLSALIGVQRSDVKSKIVIGSHIVQIAIVATFVGTHGLMAMAWGQIGQYIFTLMAAHLIFRQLVAKSSSSLFPMRFDKIIFRELLGFGLKLQAANLISFVFEPLTKFVISTTAGLGALGLFEMTYRMVLQIRHIVAAPLQTLVPAFAHLHEVNKNESRSLYVSSLATTVMVSGALLFSVALASPLISILWLGHLNWIFCLFTVLCCLGWFFNIICAPAYLFGVSCGYLTGNIHGHLVTSFLSPAIAYMAGRWFGLPWLVVALSMAGLAAGALIAAWVNSRALGLALVPPLAACSTAWHKFIYMIINFLRCMYKSFES